MNIFRLLGDLSHLASFFFLLQRLHAKRGAVGISLKTQELYLLVFITRYLDLFTNFHSLYNSMMKIVYLGVSGWVVYMLRYKDPWKTSYKQEESTDSFLHWKFAVAPAAVLALIFNEGTIDFTSHYDGVFYGFCSWVFEVCWAFSIILESVAIMPQVIMTWRHKQVENITSWYMASLGAYRFLYILNWVYRYNTEPHYTAWLAWSFGAIQTLLYADFFYYFIQAKMHGQKHVILPQ